MNDIFAFVFLGGKLGQDVTSVTLVDNTAKTVDTAVPSGKRWLLRCIKAVNCDNVARVITFNKYKEAAKTNLIKQYMTLSCLTTVVLTWPNSVTGYSAGSSVPQDEILDGGNVIEVVWAAGGASAGATDADGLVIEYLEVDA